MNGGCDRRGRQPAPAKPPAQSSPPSRPVVEFSREEVFEACGRLSLAHQCLIRGGDLVAAFELASVLDLLEGRVVA